MLRFLKKHEVGSTSEHDQWKLLMQTVFGLSAESLTDPEQIKGIETLEKARLFVVHFDKNVKELYEMLSIMRESIFPFHESFEHRGHDVAMAIKHLYENGVPKAPYAADSYDAYRCVLKNIIYYHRAGYMPLLTKVCASSGNGTDFDLAPEKKLKLVKFLLDQGIDPNKRDGLFSSALKSAVAFSEVEVVRLLLDHGAEIDHDVQLADHLLTDHIYCAIYHKHIETAKLLADRGAPISAQAIAVAKKYERDTGDIGIVSYLYETPARKFDHPDPFSLVLFSAQTFISNVQRAASDAYERVMPRRI